MADKKMTPKANPDNRIVRRMAIRFPIGSEETFAPQGTIIELLNSKPYMIVRKDDPDAKKFYFISAAYDSTDEADNYLGYHEIDTIACIDPDVQCITVEKETIFGNDIEKIIPGKVSFKEIHRGPNNRRNKNPNAMEFMCTVGGKNFSICTTDLLKISPISGFGYPFMGYVTDINEETGDLIIDKVKVSDIASIVRFSKNIGEIYSITKMEIVCDTVDGSIEYGNDCPNTPAEDIPVQETVPTDTCSAPDEAEG